MNRIYKVIYSKVKHCYVVTSEFAKANTKASNTGSKTKTAAVAAAVMLAMSMGGGALVLADDTTVPADTVQNEQQNQTATDPATLLALQEIALKSGKQSPAALAELPKTSQPAANTVSTEKTETLAAKIDEPVTEQQSAVNENGFYVSNGQGTYNSLTKDGLWVGGTNDTTGLHVDNNGKTTISDGTHTTTIDADSVTTGTLHAKTGEIEEDLTVGGKATAGNLKVNGSETVAGDSHIGRNQYVDGNSYVGKNSMVEGAVSVGKDLTVQGQSNLKNTTVDGTLGVTGSATVDKNLTVHGQSNLKDTDVDGDLDVTGSTTVGAGLTVQGPSNLKNTIVDGTLGVTGDANVDKDLTVTGQSNLKDTTADGTLSVTGNVTVDRDLTINGTSNLKNTNVGGQLDVTGSAVVKQNLEIQGNTDLQGTTVHKNLAVKGNEIIDGNSAIGGDQDVAKNSHIKGILCKYRCNIKRQAIPKCGCITTSVLGSPVFLRCR